MKQRNKNTQDPPLPEGGAPNVILPQFMIRGHTRHVCFFFYTDEQSLLLYCVAPPPQPIPFTMRHDTDDEKARDGTTEVSSQQMKRAGPKNDSYVESQKGPTDLRAWVVADR